MKQNVTALAVTKKFYPLLHCLEILFLTQNEKHFELRFGSQVHYNDVVNIVHDSLKSYQAAEASILIYVTKSLTALVT